MTAAKKTARQPTHLERAGMLTPRERLWDAARKLSRKGDGLFTMRDLQDATKPHVVNWQTCLTYRSALVRAGYLVDEGPKKKGNHFPEGRYRLVKDQLDAPRLNPKGEPTHEGLGLLAMWRAMQVLKVFDYHDVQRAACAPGFEVRLASVKNYVAELARAGYFALVEAANPAPGKNHPARYRLVRNTGALAPAVCKRHAVFDRNKGEFMWQQPAQEVVDGIK